MAENTSIRSAPMTSVEESRGPSAAAADEVGTTGRCGPRPDRAKPGNGSSNLFGRGLLYVVALSMQMVFATIVSPIVTHVIGPSEFGRYASALAVYQVLVVVAVLGMDQAVSIWRVRSQDDTASRALMANAIVVAALFATLVGCTGRFWAGFLGFGHFDSLLLATVLWVAPAAVVKVSASLMLAEDRLRAYVALMPVAFVGGQVLGLVLLTLGPTTAATYAWGGVVSQFVALVISLKLTRPIVRGLREWQRTRAALAVGIPLAVSGLASFVLDASDRIVIQRDLGSVQVGRYQVAYILGSVVLLLLTYLSASWTPRFVAIADRSERMKQIGNTRDQVIRMISPIVLGVTLGAPVALRILAPPAFHPDGLLNVVFLVVASAYPVAVSQSIGRWWISEGRTRPTAAATSFAALCNLGLNLAVVPLWGIAGSASATVLSYSVVAVAQRLLVRGVGWPKVAPIVALEAVIVVGFSAGSLALPQTPFWIWLRFTLACTCLPWFVLRLRAARRQGEPGSSAQRLQDGAKERRKGDPAHRSTRHRNIT